MLYNTWEKIQKVCVKKPDWKNGERKYFIWLDRDKLAIDWTYDEPIFGMHAFETREKAQEFIDSLTNDEREEMWVDE